MDFASFLTLCLLALVAVFLLLRRRGRSFFRRGTVRSSLPARRGITPPKRPWVRKEVLRLKALMPEHGCRKIADVFNHLHQAKRRMTVGKSFVAGALRGQEKEIARLRRKIKHRRPRPIPKNRIWALDLTYLAGSEGSHTVLGLVDHGTRLCLALRHVRQKTSIQILRCLFDAIESYGAPRSLRTDNEAVFTSKLFRFGLCLLGIRHQRTAPFAPWQNGRIERFFGTFKPLIRKWHKRAGVPKRLAEDLDVYRSWYNHLRPHQHLDGRTPAMAWTETKPSGCGRPRYFSEWDGLLAGFLVPREAAS